MTSEILNKNNSNVKSIVIYPHILDNNDLRSPEDNLEEICSLAKAISLEVVEIRIYQITQINLSIFIGTGKKS